VAGERFRIDLTRDFPDLPRAPIVEAVLHWRAVATTNLDEQGLRERLAESFADYEISPQHNIETALTGSPNGMEFKQSATWDGFRLVKQENHKPVFACQFKTNGLIFSRLAPYTDWDQFQSEALRFWNAFVQISDPSEIAQLGTRYISQIPIQSDAQIADYIEVIAQPLADIGMSSNEFYHQDTVNLDDLPYIINLVRAVQRTDPGASTRTLIVDIDVATTSLLTDFNRLESELQNLRAIKNEVFFTLMKDVESKFGAES